MINPLEKILERRFDTLFQKLDFDVNNIILNTSIADSNKQWIILNQKLVLHGYVTSEESMINGCYYVIKNIIWKDIINYIIQDNIVHIHMIWTKNIQNYEKTIMFPYFNRGLILNKSTKYSGKSMDNLNMLYSIIINYLLLLNPIVLNHLISDLSNVLKKYMFDVMLVI